MKIININSAWPEELLADVQQAFPTVQLITIQDRADLINEIADAEVVFGRISREEFLAAKRLKWIQCPGAGVETMAQISEIAESDVIVTNTRGAHAATIAEHTFGLLISMTRRLPRLFQAQREHDWFRRFESFPIGLSGLTMGLIGLGNIGRAIARRGHAFDMQVIAIDANEMPRPDYVAELRLSDGLPDLLRRSDVVVVTTPKTPQTVGMLGPEELALMKSTAYLLVVSRGGIIDEEALMAMLTDGRLAGAGLDVTATEPLPPDSPLWDTPNLLLTPHCSGISWFTRVTATNIFRENLRRYLAGEPLTNLVDLARGY